jgi:quercetin 2,3-dioxygenase
MPFYEIAEMKESQSKINSAITRKTVAGELMKAGIVTKEEGAGPPLHMHPNEEQFVLVLEGKLHYIVGDEERIAQKGDLIHIPRNTNHRSRAVDGPAVFLP